MVLTPLLLALAMAAAPTYKCKDAAGAVTFSDRPCGGNAEVVKIRRDVSRSAEQEWCDQGPAPAELVARCVDAWRPAMRDPRGAYADGGVLVRGKNSPARAVIVDGYAKNGYGGTNAVTMWCGLASGDALDSEKTGEWVKAWQALDAAGIKGGLPKNTVNCGKP